jgi:hypothetical protein
MSGYVNYAPSTKGRVVAICEHCGKRSKPCRPDTDGEPHLWGVGRGWSQAPYPPDFQHDDGSIGSTWTCPACNKRFDAGESLKIRQYPAPDAAGHNRAKDAS